MAATLFLAVFVLSGAAVTAPEQRRVVLGASGVAASGDQGLKNEKRTSRAGSNKPATKVRSNKQSAKLARNQPVELFNVNQRERIQIRLRDANGRPVRGQQKRFDHFLRCHYTNVQHAMNPRLVSLIYRTGHHWPGRRVEVVSGYRHPKFAKNPRSPHMKGLACDFRVAGVPNAELRDYLRRTFDKVGVGYYPNSSFVHLDVRKDRSAFWIDYSGPGERALYSAAPGDDLRSGRAETFHPSKIDRTWIEGGAGAADPRAEALDGQELSQESSKQPSKELPNAPSNEPSNEPSNAPLRQPVSRPSSAPREPAGMLPSARPTASR